MPPPVSHRLLHVDALKALAAQCIVLHHLAAYGPVADAVQALWPALIGFLYDDARMAVQVFLVVGGFLSARALLPDGQQLRGHPPALLWRRYRRLAWPFMAAVLLTLGCSLLVAPWLPDLMPASVGIGQLVAHALLLHGVLGVDSLTAGAWYVAIDLQLFALLLGLLWLARGRPAARVLGPLLVLALLAASLFVWNRDAGQDNWGWYFFGAYGLGAMAHIIGTHPALDGRRLLAWLVLGGLTGAALMLDFRGRIALALVTALLLAGLQWRADRGHALLGEGRLAQRAAALISDLGAHSYALFLVHFPVLLLVNALFVQLDTRHLAAAVTAWLAAWGLSNLAAVPFHRWVVGAGDAQRGLHAAARSGRPPRGLGEPSR
jgi:peptidoglycan/LPS O-acetylase OafA/YrhL